MNTNIGIYRISVPQFAILKEIVPNEKILLDTKIFFEYNAELMLVACNVGYDFRTESDLILKMVCKCEYQFTSDDWKTLFKNDKPDFPKELLSFLTMQTIGTARGILFCKVENTPLSVLMIPPVNLSE